MPVRSGMLYTKGMISIKSDGPYENIQRLMLEEEGINFDLKNRVPLKVYQWDPEASG
jgi:alkylated DNA nucleotide flippase Atl1